MTAIINTSKTYNFSPSLGEFVINAFGRIGVRPSEITQSHMFNARLSANFILSEWANMTPNLWEVGLQSMPLLQGIGTYSVPAETVMILDMYVNWGGVDHYIYPISRTEYASYAQKQTQSPPNVYWYDRLISQTVTFYPVPDGNGPYVANFYAVRQTQDAVLQNGLTVEIPYRFCDAYCAGLAWKLSEIYAPAMEDRMFNRYERSRMIAQKQDVENVNLTISPGLAGYYR